MNLTYSISVSCKFPTALARPSSCSFSNQPISVFQVNSSAYKTHNSDVKNDALHIFTAKCTYSRQHDNLLGCATLDACVMALPSVGIEHHSAGHNGGGGVLVGLNSLAIGSLSLVSCAVIPEVCRFILLFSKKFASGPIALCEEILLVVHCIVQSVSFVDGPSTAHGTGCGSGGRLSLTNLQCCLERE